MMDTILKLEPLLTLNRIVWDQNEWWEICYWEYQESDWIKICRRSIILWKNMAKMTIFRLDYV